MMWSAQSVQSNDEKSFICFDGYVVGRLYREKTLTPEEQWHGFCTSVGNAARSIVFDRQQAIEKSQAIEHANKIEDEITKNSS